MAEYLIQSESLTNIADAIRLKTGTTGAISVPDMSNQIASIQTGVELPTLTTPAADSEVFEGKEYIKQDGSAGTGTFTLSDEISAQDVLIAQIQEALEGKGAVTVETVTGTITIAADADYFDMYAGIAYTAANLEYVYGIIPEQGMTLTIPRGSIVCVEDGVKSYSGCRHPFGAGNEFAEFEDDFNITIY